MKILVCADLHAGARTWGVDRKEEILFALSQIYDVAMDFNIGALFVLGDVFHSFRYPGEDIVTPVAEFFSKILNLNSKPFVYMLKGNHDWSGIKIWELFQDDGRFVFVDEVTFLRLDDFMVFLVPYLRKHNLPKGKELKEFLESQWDSAPEGGVRLCFAHMALDETVPGLSEVTLPEDILRDLKVDKTICGHIHRHGRIMDRDVPVYYVGSPLRLDFTEEDNHLGVYVIDEKANVIDIPLEGRPLVTLQYEDEAEASARLKESVESVSQDAYIRVILDRSSLPASQLLEKFRFLVDERIVVVSINEGFTPITSSTQDPFDVVALWKRYIECQEEDDVTKQILKTVGESLLLGKDPSTIWQELKFYFEIGEQE